MKICPTFEFLYVYSELEVWMIIWSLENPWVHFYIYLLNCSVPESLEQMISVYFLIFDKMLIARSVLPAPQGSTI